MQAAVNTYICVPFSVLVVIDMFAVAAVVVAEFTSNWVASLDKSGSAASISIASGKVRVWKSQKV